MALKETCPTLKKVGEEEEIFVLRAQDITAPKAILRWITENFNSTPTDKLREAFECAIRMRRHTNRKYPD